MFFILVLKQFYGKNKKIRFGVSVVILALLTTIISIKFPDVIENSFQLNKEISEVNYTESTIPLNYRALVWECSSKIANGNTSKFFGIGFRETSNKLVNCYENEIKDLATKQNFINKRFNTHNQYLDFYISSGLISLVLFLGILVILLFKHYKHFFPTALVLTFILFGLVENYFHRQVGAYYLGFVLVILLINNNKNSLCKKLNETPSNEN